MEKLEMNTNTRNYGIDLLKMIAMFMVVVLHVLGQGGILWNTQEFSANYGVSWLLEIAAFCAVNCFALASGYVMVNLKFKYHRIGSLWLQVVFYGLVITGLFAIFVPGSVGVRSWINAISPVLSNQYWYFTSYFGMFFFIPFFNFLLNSMSKRMCTYLVITIVVIFSILPTFYRLDLFLLDGGYSMLWLSALYIMGGYVKKYEVGKNLKTKYAVMIYFGAVLLTLMMKVGIAFTTFKVFGEVRQNYFVIDYTSPTIVLSAVMLLFAFSKLDFQNKLIRKVITIGSPLAFSVYIIHSQSLVWDYVMQGRFNRYLTYHPAALLLAVVGTALVIYIICSVIDLVRHQLFKVLNVHAHCERMVTRIQDLLSKIKLFKD